MATKKTDKSESRLRFIGLAAVVAVLFLVFQLFEKSVIDHAKALAAAKRQQLTKKELVSKRGTIYASSEDGVFPLAVTDEKYDISAVPKNIVAKKEAAQFLANLLNLDEKDVLEKIDNNKLYIPPLAKRVDRKTAEKVVKKNMRGVIVIPRYVRYYMEDSLAAHVLGFVNFEGDGKYGVEGFYDEQLKGYSGNILAERDRNGRYISIMSKNEPKDGDSLILTIDHNVQFAAEKELALAIEKYKAQSGQVVIIDVKTGDIVAMASSPSFNPNKFNEVKREEQGIFLNPVIGSVYEPGSIFKPIIVAIGLDSGKVEPDMEGEFGNMTVVQGYEIHTAQDKAFGKENITQILENSDNVAMVWVADKIGNKIIYDYLKKFGFGAKYGIDSSGETTGNLLDLKKWRDINRATISFGQGISATPLQILMAYQALGNDGELVQPRLVKSVIRQGGDEEDIEVKKLRRVVSSETAKQIQRMLISVVERGHGKKAKVKGYVIGGKTGTAQIPKKDSPGYEEDASIASFAGLIPGDSPRYAMLVKLDRPTGVEFAAQSAAPTFSRIAKFLLQYYHIPASQELRQGE